MRAGLLLLLALVVACDGSRDGEQQVGSLQAPASATSRRDPATVIVGRPADALSLDPGRVGDNESVEVVEQIFETLLTYDAAAREVRPGLASSWKVSDDGRVWTFALRQGIRFHDGTALDAAAVVFSLERQRDPAHRFHERDRTGFRFTYWQNLYRNVQKVEAVDARTVRVTIDRRHTPFAANMAMFPVSIVSPTAVARWGPDFYRHPVGTGPFRFVKWESGLILLERNPDYWGTPPAIGRLVFRAIADARQRLTELESAAIDVAYSLLPDELQFVELHPDLTVYQEPAAAVAFLAMNTSHPPFDDLRVRQAVNHAVNKDSIVKLAYQKLATAATGPLPPSQWGHHKPRATYPYDLERARALLAEAARDGRFDPERTYRFYSLATPRAYMPDPEFIARVIQANLAEVGLKTDLVVQRMRKHMKSVQNGEHDLCLFGWIGDSGDPDDFLTTLFDQQNNPSGLARNLAFYRDRELDDLLRAGQAAGSRRERLDIYRAAQERIADQAPWVPLAHSHVAIAARMDVGGIVIKPTAVVEFKGVRRVGR
jgi:peptide/nickel transport system substrate-binding protein